jgi:hypothetical protein
MSEQKSGYNRRGRKVTTGKKNVKTPTKLTGGSEKGNVIRGWSRTGRRTRQGASRANVTSNQQQGPARNVKVTKTGGETVKTRIGQKTRTFSRDMLDKIRMWEGKSQSGSGKISGIKGGTDANYTGVRRTGPNRQTGASRIGRLISGSKGGDSSPQYAYKIKPDSGGPIKQAISLISAIKKGSVAAYILNDIMNTPTADGTLDAHLARERSQKESESGYKRQNPNLRPGEVGW